MKAMLALLVMHVAVGGLAAHFFQEHIVTRIEPPPGGWKHLSSLTSVYEGPPRAAVRIYGVAGLIALFVAFCYECFRRFRS